MAEDNKQPLLVQQTTSGCFSINHVEKVGFTL